MVYNVRLKIFRFFSSMPFFIRGLIVDLSCFKMKVNIILIFSSFSVLSVILERIYEDLMKPSEIQHKNANIKFT